MQLIGYLFFLFFSRLISLTPFKLLYLFSDFIAWLLHKVFKYRREVILKNLRFAFPDKEESELLGFLPDIYRNFSDILLESFKSSFIPVQRIIDRYEFLSNEEFESEENVKDGIVIFAAHYGNWEWATLTIQTQTPFQVIGLIKPLTNKYINAFIARSRSKTGTGLVDIYGDKSALYATYDKPSSIVYIADQNPGNKEKAHKIQFFGRDTLALHGGAEYALQFPEKAVWFYKIERQARGRYTVTPIKLFDNSHGVKSGAEISQKYFAELEKQITRNPSDWLWTHKRWKAQIKY